LAAAFFVPALAAGYIYLSWLNRTATGTGDGQSGIMFLGIIVGVPCAIIAGYAWLSYSLDRLAKLGIIPNEKSKHSPKP
jgi:hypothetical protein